MADSLAWEKVFDDVVTTFAADASPGDPVPNVFGWQAPSQRGAQQNRICWVPGDPSGAAGDVGPAMSPGGNPRSLGTMGEIFTIYVEARNAASPENERLQYAAARLLFDAWFRAAYLSVKNLLAIKSAVWMRDRKARVNGATIRVVCTVQSEIPDVAYVAAEDVTAVVDVQLDGDNDDGTPNASEDVEVPALEEV